MEEKMIAIKKIIAVGGVLLGTAGIVHAYLRTAPSKAAREFTDLAEDLLKGTEPAKGRCLVLSDVTYAVAVILGN